MGYYGGGGLGLILIMVLILVVQALIRGGGPSTHPGPEACGFSRPLVFPPDVRFLAQSGHRLILIE